MIRVKMATIIIDEDDDHDYDNDNEKNNEVIMKR